MINYTLDVHCLNENQVSVSYGPIGVKPDEFDLVTMQYTCFDAEQQVSVIHAIIYNDNYHC